MFLKEEHNQGHLPKEGTVPEGKDDAMSQIRQSASCSPHS